MSATGSAGTIAAGDYLKARHGTKIAAVEAIECPTMLENGYGEHNIQGIGDKHIPLIHNVMNTDVVVGVSDASSDALNLLFNGNVGRALSDGAAAKSIPAVVRRSTTSASRASPTSSPRSRSPSTSSSARSMSIMTVATDSAALYDSERASYLARRYPRRLRRGATPARSSGSTCKASPTIT